jgi:signal transduction histidine kinase
MDAVAETTQSRNLQRIIDAAGKAGALVRQLLDFSRQTPPQMEALRLSALLARTRPLLAAALPPGVQLQAQADADSLVQLDPSQMEQVLLNLVNNAAHAMRRDGGTVRIVVDHGEGGLGMPPMARLRVIDSGEGIAPALLPKIFEPFFTTKPVGVGTGLGLAAVHGIVTRHGGQIAVASEPGHGTTFTLLLPAAPVPAPDPIPLQGHHP